MTRAVSWLVSLALSVSGCVYAAPLNASSPVGIDPNITLYGFTPVARDPNVLFSGISANASDQPEFTVDDFPLPDSPLIRSVKAFVQNVVDEQTFNHSNRAYVFGVAVTRTHFPHWQYDLETYYLACLLHDIGTTEKYLKSTKMSFEFKGAIVARELILSLGAPRDQADSVGEAIIRHVDVFVNGGNIAMIGQILQLSTIMDNVGTWSNFLHPRLIETTTAAYARNGWSEHFAEAIEREETVKPWCHLTTWEVPNWKPGMRSQFAAAVRNDTAMAPYDQEV
ncbi:cyanamide hydratase [Marasmius fiardii PR-910]|nr:cyanamide hydratase [Marasmius fiardii PR-910]